MSNIGSLNSFIPNPIIQTQERMKLQSQQKFRIISSAKVTKKRPRTTNILVSKTAENFTKHSPLFKDPSSPQEAQSSNSRTGAEYSASSMKSRHFFLLRSMKKIKDSEERERTMVNNTEAIFNDLAANLTTSSKTELKEPKIQKFVINTSNSSKMTEVVHNNSMKNWLKKKGIKEKTIELHRFAYEFFDLIDLEKTGEIQGENLLKSLLSFGVANSPNILRLSLSLAFNTKDLATIKVTAAEFVNLFKYDQKIDKILRKLNEYCLEQRLSKNRNSLYVQTPLEIARTSTFMENKEGKPVTINEHADLIRFWWKSLNDGTNETVTVTNSAKLLVSVSIATDRNDAKNLIFSIVGIKKTINFEEFQQLFVRSSLKGAFSNLSKRLLGENFACKEMSSEFKLSAYQRALIMSGIKCPNSEITVEEGATTLAAIEKYNVQMNNHEIVDYEEFRKKLYSSMGISMLEAERRKSRIIEKMKISDKISTAVGKIFQNVPKFVRKNSKIANMRRSNSPAVVLEKIDVEGLETSVLSPRRMKKMKKRRNELLTLIAETKKKKKKYDIEYDILKKYQNLVNFTPDI